MTTLNLEEANTDQGGRTWYHPVVRRIKGVSQYRDTQFALEGLPGYWDWNGDFDLQIGQAYEFTLTTKPKTGAQAKAGSLYQDIRKAETTDEAPPAYSEDDPRDPYTSSPEPRTAPKEAPPLPQALGACQNHAMAYIESGIISVPEGRDPLNFHWELRDTIYRNVNQRPYMADPHYCYQHDSPQGQGKTGAWGHRIEGGWCVEGTQIMDEVEDATTDV